jgi:hypothetical protein
VRLVANAWHSGLLLPREALARAAAEAGAGALVGVQHRRASARGEQGGERQAPVEGGERRHGAVEAGIYPPAPGAETVTVRLVANAWHSGLLLPREALARAGQRLARQQQTGMPGIGDEPHRDRLRAGCRRVEGGSCGGWSRRPDGMARRRRLLPRSVRYAASLGLVLAVPAAA